MALAFAIALPGALAIPAGVVPGGHGLRNLASDPQSFPPADYSNLPISLPPAVPDTTPVVLNLTNYGTVGIPWGTWETVVMNYTGYTAGTAYDYFQTVTIDNAMVYVGVNPEAGHWTQFVNLSDYLAFFDDQPTITISGPHLGMGGNFEGIQSNYITLLFYPVPAGQPGPSYPSLVEPLFRFTGVPSQASIHIPADTSAAVLQMMAIGPEFWYSLNPDYTAVTVAIGGHDVATYLQYPWINSGGIDLFSWRPIFPVHMLDHQWEDFNLTGALGMIEGTQTLATSHQAGQLGAAVIANLLVYTDPAVQGASLKSYAFDQPPVQTVDQVNASMVNVNGNDYTVYDQFENLSYQYASTIRTATGHATVALTTSESYANEQTLTPVWQNITESEVTASHQVTTYDEAGRTGTVVQSQTLSYPLAMQIGEALTYEYSQGSDSFWNYTSYFLNVTQGYEEIDATQSALNGVSTASYRYLNDAITGTNGFFLSTLEFGPGFAIILNITASYHLTNKAFTLLTYQQAGDSTRGEYYHRALSGIENNSTSYYVQETVTQDSVTQYALSQPTRGVPGA